MNGPALSAATAQPVHLVFEWLALAGGVQLYRWQRRRAHQPALLQPDSFAVVVGCILGAAIGNKLVFWIEMPHLWQGTVPDWRLIASGQSIVGGLLGGLLGVEIAKKLTRIRRSTGDQFILPLVAGTVVGRIGCFLAGLNDGTYGVPTALPWGVDFGDGIARHPTQVYDMLFVLGVGGLLWRWRAPLARSPGLAFKLYLASYLAWRLVVDAIKPVPYAYAFGLSGIQWVCIAALVCYLPFVFLQSRELVRT
ncbi:diacylglyceryl transferase [Massilia sp. Root133]|uniref:Diacylglyceryl transferase n=1 Tax=Massilia cellulosiltytica TaxID=2683234 RepID=A0A7X3G316_9BURK|nr:MULTISPECIES: prolipoprotein diacylglyceryl transferase family protein [Telluria group]KQY18610.1 diacylglyceryl transferase [Massilia sp. Root133]KQZ53838.1 diacylglyceryl transferase [Massilia sp. Root1485]MVW62054.1 diacylglyceryl transferase [Telluria cellulosilytica]